MTTSIVSVCDVSVGLISKLTENLAFPPERLLSAPVSVHLVEFGIIAICFCPLNADLRYFAYVPLTFGLILPLNIASCYTVHC